MSSASAVHTVGGMEPKILIAYASRHGSTQEVAEQVAQTLRDSGLDVDVRPASSLDDVDAYDAVVIGGALYMGHWHRDARRLLSRVSEELSERPVFVFGMGPTDLEPKSVEEARHHVDEALAKVPDVHPVSIAIFGGVVHPDDLHFPFNHMPETDARDPEAIRAWSDDVAAVLTTRRVTPAP
jgi:menaquinone-dependent protoporphyrinogen oxidase